MKRSELRQLILEVLNENSGHKINIPYLENNKNKKSLYQSAREVLPENIKEWLNVQKKIDRIYELQNEVKTFNKDRRKFVREYINKEGLNKYILEDFPFKHSILEIFEYKNKILRTSIKI
jgi:hypothetical protein